MARDDLRPCRTSEEAKVRGRNGGIASGQSRRKKKALRELVRLALEERHKDHFGEETGQTQAERIASLLVSQASYGNLKAMQMLFSLEAESVRCEAKDVEEVSA